MCPSSLLSRPSHLLLSSSSLLLVLPFTRFRPSLPFSLIFSFVVSLPPFLSQFRLPHVHSSLHPFHLLLHSPPFYRLSECKSYTLTDIREVNVMLMVFPRGDVWQVIGGCTSVVSHATWPWKVRGKGGSEGRKGKLMGGKMVWRW